MTESTESVASTAAFTDTSTEPLRIAILAGGLSHERYVSLRSGHRVASVLKHLGHTVLVLDVDARTIASLRAFGPDVVWPLVHGSHGEDGGLQNVLIALGMPYVGTHSDGCQRASFKPTAKATVRRRGVATPDSVTLPKAYSSRLTLVYQSSSNRIRAVPASVFLWLMTPMSFATPWWPASLTTSGHSSSSTFPAQK